MNTKPEALRLADALDAAPYSCGCTMEAAAELRRLSAWNAYLTDRARQRNKLLEALKAAIVRAELRREGAVDVELLRAAIAKVKGEKK